MLRLAADADTNGSILRGLIRRRPELDILRSFDEIGGDAKDPEVLEWAASEERVLLTNDRQTMLKHIWERKAEGKPIPGVILTTLDQSVGSAIDDILFLAEGMPPEEIADRVVVYLPFRG